MSSHSEHADVSRKNYSLEPRGSPVQPSATSNEAKDTPASTSSNESHPHSTSTSPSFSFRVAEQKWRTKTRSFNWLPKTTLLQSMRETSSPPLMKPRDIRPSGIPERDDPVWRVKLLDQPAALATVFGFDDPEFNPLLAEVLEVLENDPQQYPTLHRKLDGLRVASLRYNGTVWALPFTIHEGARVVTVLRIDPYGDTYKKNLAADDVV